MPTTRPRHHVTETTEISEALDRAAHRWPGLSRAQLLVRLVELGSTVLGDSDRDRREAHITAVLASSGQYAEAFPVGYLDELRAEWPD